MAHIRLIFRTPTDQDIQSIIERVNSELLGRPLDDKTAEEARDLALKYTSAMICVEHEFISDVGSSSPDITVSVIN